MSLALFILTLAGMSYMPAYFAPHGLRLTVWMAVFIVSAWIHNQCKTDNLEKRFDALQKQNEELLGLLRGEEDKKEKELPRTAHR